MVSENIKYNEVIHKKLKKCEFCDRELTPIGIDYLYANFSPDNIEYERCSCKKSQEYWNEKDKQDYEITKRKHFREVINKIYKQNYIGRKFQDLNFENFNSNSENELAIAIAKDYVNKNITSANTNGLIIMGESGVGKTHLATAILNKLTEKDMLALMGRLISLLDVIKDTFKDFPSKEKDIIELYSKVDMLIIDDLGTERISSWALEKLYTIIENRNENKLPIIVTTRFNKESLLDRFCQSEDEELSEAIIQKLYQFCYGIELKKYDQNEKEKVSISD